MSLFVLACSVVATAVILAVFLFLFDEEKFFSIFWSVAAISTLWYLVSDNSSAIISSINWQNAMLGWLVWLGIGAVVSFLNWFAKISDLGNFVAAQKAKIQNFSFDDDTARNALMHALQCQNELKALGVSVYSASCYSDQYDTREKFLLAITPSASKLENVDRITWWAVLWPLVILDICFNRIINNLGRMLAKTFDKVFGKLAKKMLSRSLGED